MIRIIERWSGFFYMPYAVSGKINGDHFWPPLCVYLSLLIVSAFTVK